MADIDRRKINEENFLRKANEKHNNKYDYSLMNYVNSNTPITIICPLHGAFERTPSSHLSGSGCPICTKIRVRQKSKEYWTEERRKAKSEAMKDPKTLEKRRETNRKRYGSDNWASSEEAKQLREQGEGPWSKDSYDKARQTRIERYGAKTWAESEIGRQTLSEMCSSEDVRKKMSERASRPEVIEKRKETNRERYGADYWTQSDVGKTRLKEIFSSEEIKLKRSEIAKESVPKRIETNLKRYGVEHYWQHPDAKKRLKHLLNSPEVIEKTKNTNLERYGVEIWQTSDEAHKLFASREYKMKVFETKKKNGTIQGSKLEDRCFELLLTCFDELDIIRQYNSERYPFNCDFYIKSLDLFIELNANWTHGDYWYDSDIENNKDILEYWKYRANNGSHYYADAVETWSSRDIEKREFAKKNDLNYIVFWNNNLKEVEKWISEGCLIRKDWNI